VKGDVCMVNVRIEEKPEFTVIGEKIWISGTNDNEFGEFWQRSHENGLITTLKQIRQKQNNLGPITNSMVFGVSCVEKDPSNRSFYFYIATEANNNYMDDTLETYVVPASKWAIFRNEGEMPKALIDAEMYAFLEWLPNSKYTHAYAPELEVYPPGSNCAQSTICEFWLPIQEKK